MLLRASRVSGSLTKEALVGKVLGSAAKGTLGFAGKHWKGVGGTALVGASMAPEISSSSRRAQVGLSQPWLQASNAGMVPRVPPGHM